AIRGVIGQGEPARRKQQVRAGFVDGRKAHPSSGTVLLIRERSGVVEGERDRFSGRHYVRRADRQNEWVIAIPLERERFSGRPQDGVDPQILVKLDDDATPGLLRDEFHL